MNEIKLFESEQFGKIRTVIENGEPWFVAQDICEALELSNVSVSVARLDSDEVTKFNLGSQSGETNIISESGLYSLVLGSRKPEAKEFKRWITHEVIPSIRKHGAYMTPNAIEQAILDPDFMIGLLQNLKAEQAKRIEAEQTIKALEPKADFYDAVAGSKDAIEIGNAAKVLGIPGLGRNKLFDLLRCNEILDESNIPYQKYIDCGYFRVIEQKYTKPNGETRISFKTLVYQRGLDYIRKLMKKVGVK